ncbi:MAG TPA: hypothetical protein VMU45_08550 [Candidatus Eisenbacteria bacterium]|nr:hypothetical protein [Candidatus Eisenbacteria bacterium]
MPDPRPCRRAPRRPDARLGPDALEHLAHIRQTMERSTSFTAVSGWGYVAMGVTALVAAPIAMRQATTEGWLAVWLAEALVAVTLALVAMHWKASRLGTPILSTPGRRLFVGLLPALFAGGVMTVALVRVGDPRQIPGVWLLLYGVAVMQAGAFSVRTIPVMGAVFVLAGAIALPLPWYWANGMLAVGFGLVHIAFGAYIARRHGG